MNHEEFNPYARQGEGKIETPAAKYRKDLDVILAGDLVTIEALAESKDGENYYKIEGLDEPVAESQLSPAVEIQGSVLRSKGSVEIQGPVLQSKKSVEILEEK